MKAWKKLANRISEATKDTNNWVSITKNVDARHTGKYAIINLATNHVDDISFKTLKEVERYFGFELFKF